MHIVLVRIIRVVAVIAWGLAAIDLSPWLMDLRPDAQLFTIAVACVSSYALICRAHAWPAHEVYLAGKEMGRREAQAATGPGERRLRVVDGSQ